MKPFIAATIPTIGGLHAATIENGDDSGYEMTGSTVVVYAKSWDVLDRFRVIPYARNLPDPHVAPWTADFSDVLGPFLSKYRKRE